MTNEKMKKFAQESGLTEEEVNTVVRKIAACRQIEKIHFRAETALYTEFSLVYDDLSLAEMPEERTEIINGKLKKLEVILRSLIKTTENAVKRIMEGEAPADVNEDTLYTDLRKVEESDDDEKIAEFLLGIADRAIEAAKAKVLREYDEDEGGGDEH